MMQMNSGNYDNNHNYNSEDSSLGTVFILGVVGIGIACMVLALAFIGKTLFTAVVSLTVPALVKSFAVFSAPGLSVGGLLTVSLEGVLVGLFIGCLRRLYIKGKIAKTLNGKRREIGKSLISNLLTFPIFKFETSLVFVILLNMLVGFLVGWIQGAAGATGFFHALFSADKAINYSTIVGTLISGGGAGGAGTGNPVSFVLFILIIFIVQGIIIGAATGLTFGVLFGAVTGAVKSGSTELFSSLLSDVGNEPIGKGRKIAISTIKGMIQGVVVGGIVGLVQGIIILLVASSSKR